MQQFQVPQFIEVEDKIFGPLTTKQFFYLLGGGGISFLLWYSFTSFFLFILLATPVIALSVSLAFVKINGKPFIDLVSNSVLFFVKPRLYLWKKVQRFTSNTGTEDTTLRQNIIIPKVSGTKLNDLAWSLDIMKNAREEEKGKKSGIQLKI